MLSMVLLNSTKLSAWASSSVFLKATATLCALRCLPDQYALPPRFPIFADFQIKQNGRVAKRLVEPSRLHVTFGREVADRCLAFCALRPTEGQVAAGAKCKRAGDVCLLSK